MKILLYALAAVFAAAVAASFASCSGKEAVLDNKITLSEGEEFRYLFNQKLTCEVESKLRPYKMEVMHTLRVRFVVRDVNVDGSYNLLAYVEHFSNTGKTSEGDVDIDSDKMPQNDLFPIVDITKAAPLLFTLTKNGEFTDERFPDDFIEQIRESFPAFDSISLTAMYTHLNNIGMGEFINQCKWFVMPPAVMAVGGEWNAPVVKTFALDIPAVSDTVFRFEGKSKGKLKVASASAIEAALTREMDGDAFTFYDMKGSSEGSTLINSDNGLIHSSSASAELIGTVEIPALLPGEKAVPARMSLTVTMRLMK